MSKIKLLTNNQLSYSFCHLPHLRPLVEKYFEIVDYNRWTPNGTDKYVVVINFATKINDWHTPFVNAGAKLVVDNLWEFHQHNQITDKFNNSAYVCSSKKFFWINEHYWYKSLGYDTYVPNKSYTHTALMPMGLQKPHRDLLLEKLTPYIDEIIYSYLEKNITLPDDILLNESIVSHTRQRYFNSTWYDNTYFSIVAETFAGQQKCLMITEKTFKPIAFKHPFMILGGTGTLDQLHTLGFETFENLFDESYDKSYFYPTQINSIVDNFKNFVKQDYDTLTLKKIKHNQKLFYNTDVVEKLLLNEIINPILEYAATT